MDRQEDEEEEMCKEEKNSWQEVLQAAETSHS